MAKSLSKTPAPKKDRIFGSDKNKKGSASSKASAKGIDLNDSIIETLTNKAKEYNEKNPNKRVSVATLKAVMRRGMGAYSTSHRPTITGGAPNSRQAWGFARVNKFLKKKEGQQVKAAYVQDDDLLAKGGQTSQEITCVNCGWHWNTSDSNEFDKYICHKCGFDNRTFYDPEPIGVMADGGFVAPNGKPSNLTPEQYKLVRTPEFKAWFGDWENDPENASKVVDENGEPLVVYHGTYAKEKFNNFDFNKADLGFHFGTYEQANDRSQTKIGIKDYKQFIEPFFLNIRKLFVINDAIEFEYPQTYIGDLLQRNIITEKDINENGLKGLTIKQSNEIIRNLLVEKYNNVGFKYQNQVEAAGNSYIVCEPNQIKLADGSNTTFDAANPDIRYADGGKTSQELFKPSKSIEQIAKEKDVPLDYAEEQLIKGMKTESEHSDNPMVQETIALQHLDEMIDYYEKLEYMESKDKMEKGDLLNKSPFNKALIYKSIKPLREANEIMERLDYMESQNKMSNGGVTKFYKEYLDWYIDGVCDKMTIMVSVPNAFSKMSGGDNDLILDVFEKKDENVDAKKKLTELLEIVDRNGLDVYLEPIPRLHNIKDKAKRDKITREYLIKYYENFGFELLPNGFMVRKHNKMEKGGYYKAGGEINPDNKAVKDYFAHGSGNAGGVLVGKRHSEGGIKAVNKSTNQPLEMEGGEVVITRNAVSDNTKREFNGEMLTNREILSKINESGGGVSFADGGDIPETITTSGKEYKYGGKMMKDHEIVSSCGCNHSMAEGGETDYHTEIKNHLFPKIEVEVEVEVEPEMDVMLNHEHYITADDLGLTEGMPMLAVGTIVYSSGGNDQWEVVSFSDDGVNLVNKPKSPLQSKMEDKHLTFEELIKYFKDKAISIKNISTERELEPAIALVKNKLPQKSFAVGGLLEGDEDEDAKIMQSQFGKSNFK